MLKEIIDEFTRLNISRQRKYQLRKRCDGKCIICGESANGYRRHARKDWKEPYHCERHRQINNVATRERMRRKLNCRQRNKEAESYSFPRAGE